MQKTTETTATADLASGAAVLTQTPHASKDTRCRVSVQMGDTGALLDGSGGDFSILVTIGGWAWNGGAEVKTLGTGTKAVVVTEEFFVLANEQVVVTITSPNAADSAVKTVASLFAERTEAAESDAIQVGGDATAADNLEADYDGTGYAKSNSTIGTCTTNSDMRGTDNALLASDNGSGLTEAGGNGDHLTEAGGTGDHLTAIADAVWEEAAADHTSAGSMGEAQNHLDADISSRSSHDDPDPSGFIDAAISSRSSHDDPDPLGFINAAISSRQASGAVTLTSAERDAIANALLDLASAVDGRTLRENWRMILAAMAGPSSGHDGGSPTYKDTAGNNKTRISASTSTDGRDSVSYPDLT